MRTDQEQSAKRVLPQKGYFYEPLPTRSDFSDTAFMVLLVWGSIGGSLSSSVRCRTVACERLGLTVAQYAEATKEIYRLLKLDKWKTVPSPEHAVASAVVIGILETTTPPRDEKRKGKKDADGIEDVVLVEGAEDVADDAVEDVEQ